MVWRMVRRKWNRARDVDLDGSAGSGSAPQVVMEESTNDAVEDDGDDDGAMQQHGACGRFCKWLGGQLLLKVITGLEEVAAHRLSGGYFLLPSTGRVTMEMLVMPACLTASMTLAKAPEGNALIGTKIDDFLCVRSAGVAQALTEVVYVDRVVAEEDFLIAVDGDHEALLGDFLNGACFGNVDFDTGLEHWRGDHEDHQQHQHDVDERRDVDVREGGSAFCRY